MGYSVDFRRRVLASKEKHKLTFEETAERFDVSLRSLFRWSKDVEPKKRKQHKTKIDMDALAQDVEDYPDAFQYERAERLGVSPNSVLYALRRMGYTSKKNSKTSQS